MADGDRTVEELFEDHAAFVASFLHRLGIAAADVPDLVQDVFVVVHRNGGYRAGPAKPRSWVAAIAVRVASTHRRKRREELSGAIVERAVSAAPDPQHALEVRRSLSRVHEALSALDLEHRSVFVLFEIEGVPCAEIAAALDVPIGTVYSRLHNARKKFRSAYDDLPEMA